MASSAMCPGHGSKWEGAAKQSVQVVRTLLPAPAPSLSCPAWEAGGLLLPPLSRHLYGAPTPAKALGQQGLGAAVAQRQPATPVASGWDTDGVFGKEPHQLAGQTG